MDISSPKGYSRNFKICIVEILENLKFLYENGGILFFGKDGIL
jgi:hypothetical protein